MTTFPDPCTCRWVSDEDGHPECAIGDTCDCDTHHCRCDVVQEHDTGQWVCRDGCRCDRARHWDGTTPLGGDDMDGK